MNPSLTLGPITIYYYGLILAGALLIGYVFARRRAPRYGLPESLIDGLLIISAPLGILGGRLYFVAFNLEYYAAHPSEILYLQGGGLAIHGALIGGVIGAILVWRFHQKKSSGKGFPHFSALLDVVAPVLPLAQAIGRLANYVNHEAFGTPTALPFGIYIPPDRRPAEFIDETHFHPTFAYEILWNLIGVGIVLFIEKKLRKQKKDSRGVLFAVYLGWYSLGRFWIEALRTDALVLGPLRIAQIVSVTLVLVSFGYIWYRSAQWRTSKTAPKE